LNSPAGPIGVFIGISGPTQDTWEKQTKGNTQRYGEQNKFIGQESRQRLAKAIGLTEPQKGWWVHYDADLRDADGKDISDWSEITTVTRLFSERDPLCKHIIDRMTNLAAEIGSLVIDAT
jgi:hypothetical protein